MSAAWYRAANEAEIPSPALLLFSERIDANLRQMVAIAGDAARLRPHVKTHKLAPLVERQIALGIGKFKCATIAEAEMTAAAGAQEVLLAYPCVGPNAVRLTALARKFPAVRFAAVADDANAVRVLGDAAIKAGVVLDVFLDLDCGMHRTGVEAGPRAIEVWRAITQTAGLRAAGLHAYDGHIHEPDLATRCAQCDEAFAPVLALRHHLGDVPLIAGGSPTFALHAEHADRELSPGTTVLWDFSYADKFPELPFVPAAVLLTRVVSRPASDRLCLDLGHKAVAAENSASARAAARVARRHRCHAERRAPRHPEHRRAQGSLRSAIASTAFRAMSAFHRRRYNDTAHLVVNGLARERWPILAPKGRARNDEPHHLIYLHAQSPASNYFLLALTLASIGLLVLLVIRWKVNASSPALGSPRCIVGRWGRRQRTCRSYAGQARKRVLVSMLDVVASFQSGLGDTIFSGEIAAVIGLGTDARETARRIRRRG